MVSQTTKSLEREAINSVIQKKPPTCVLQKRMLLSSSKHDLIAVIVLHLMRPGARGLVVMWGLRG